MSYQEKLQEYARQKRLLECKGLEQKQLQLELIKLANKLGI